MSTVTLGAGTNILKFPAGHEAAYINHLRFVEALKAKGAYPALAVYGLKPARPGSGPLLIVVTGSIADTQRLPKVFYTPEAEAVVRESFSDDWNAINPASSVANVADPGSSVDLGVFNALVAGIERGEYVAERTLP
ncbi:MAG: hypothetical protein WC700_08195 [Gemmatimonadaceae bacterium]|jgi:hypothetical protein